MLTVISLCNVRICLRTTLLASVAMLAQLSITQVAWADSTRAECGFAATAAALPPETSACTFSQRQGFINIDIDGGPQFALRPTGDSPGNYLDARGRAVYRRSGLGDRGQLFMLPDQSPPERFLSVYWGRETWECSGEQIANPAGCQLSMGNLVFSLHAGRDGLVKRLTVQVSGLEISNLMQMHDIEGQAYRAELADLDANGWPEVYVYVTSDGSGSYGSLVAYAVNNGKSATPIYMAPVTDDPVASKGYMGHDEFAVVENRLVQRFPVYKEGDVNSAPTGGMRQLQYRLVPGEASWQLQVDRLIEY